METNTKTLKIISNETKNNIENLDVVTPSMYNSIFLQHAISHNVTLDDESKAVECFLSEEINMLEHIREQTSHTTLELEKNTDKAISAIQDKDENTLKEVLYEIKKLKEEVEKLKGYVYQDELTNTFNRKWIQDHILKNNTKKFKEDGTLAIIDLNYFKIINDTYGHIVGDKVLIFITNQLKQTKEKIVRFGGDEFIIFFSKNINKNTANKKLDELRENILKKKIKSKNSFFKVSFSFGIAEFHEDNEFSKIIELADKDMYNDKIKIKQKITGIST